MEAIWMEEVGGHSIWETGFLLDRKIIYWWEVDITKGRNIIKFPFSDHKEWELNFKRPYSFFLEKKKILKSLSGYLPIQD